MAQLRKILMLGLSRPKEAEYLAAARREGVSGLWPKLQKDHVQPLSVFAAAALLFDIRKKLVPNYKNQLFESGESLFWRILPESDPAPP